MIKKQVTRILCIATMSSLLTGQGVFARDSEFTRQGSGPMYWISYEHQWTKNTYMPEQRLKDNIDWMAENFLPYGYDMVSTDGWIEGATMLNKNGYVVSHNDHWMTNPLDMSGNGGSTSGGKLVNGDFEDGETGWTFSGTSGHGVDSNDGHTGSKYWMWSNDPHTDSLKQTVTGLANGTYILTVWSKISGDDNFTTDGSKAEIRLGDPASSSYVVQAIEPANDEYGKVRYGSSEVEVNVTDGQLPIEFYLDAKAGGTSFQIDDITLEATGESTITMPVGNQAVNGDFEDGETGWTFDGPALHGINGSDQGATNALWTWADAPHEEKISQKINNLPAGKYKISAKAKTKNGMSTNGSTAVMRIKGYNASNPDAVDETPITSESWTTYTKEIEVTTISGNINVTTSSAVNVTTSSAVSVSTTGDIDLEFYYNSNGTNSNGIDLDDVTVEAVPVDGQEPAWQYPTEQYPDGHTWGYWADYAASKGLKYGVYYNPLWVSPEVVKNPDKYTVPGHPDIQVASLVKSDPNNAAGGDRFNGGQGNDKSLYWLNVDAPGAEEYIKGYVNFFKDQGVKFLRVDFLSWYETAYDPNLGQIGQEHTKEQYEKALQWMSEAAGPDMILSLVMPNLKDHGELERKYGDMIRIDEDVFGGGWDHTSGRRQNWQGEVWSQWAGSFQGLTGFSDIDGRGSLINDADFTRLNTFSGEYANNEKKSEVSLYTIAGAPITIADQYDTIGDNAKFYQNTELIELNKLGLSAKPIFNTNAHYKDNKSRDSERWVGQLPDGSYVIGLFNRTDEQKAFTFDFAKELGISQGSVRDLWTHQDLGTKKTHTVVLDPHDCTIIKVIPASQTSRYEAEMASYEGTKFNGPDYVSGPEFNNNHDGYTGSGFIQNISQAGDKVTFAIDAPQEGDYKLNLKYANGGDTDATVTLYSRNKVSGDTIGTQDVTLPVVKDKAGNSTWDVWGVQKQTLKLQKGVNLVTIEGKSGNVSLDSIESARGVGVAKLVNGGFESGTNGWTRIDTSGNSYFGSDSNDAYEGNKLYDYFPNAGEATISQSITNVPDGHYKVTAMVKLMPHMYPSFTGGTCELKITGTGTTDAVTPIMPKVKDGVIAVDGTKLEANEFEYLKYTAEADVKSGEMNIQFHTIASQGDTSLQLDNVTLEKTDAANVDASVPLLNSDFENGFNNWSRNNMVNQSLQKDSDNQYVKVSGDEAYNSDLWQYVVPGAGTYTLKAKVRASGKFDEASLYTNYSGGTKKTNIPVSSDWTTVELPNIQVQSDEVIKLGTLINGQAGSSVDIDDVELVQCNPQDYIGNVNYLGQLNLDETTPYTVDGNAVIFNTNGTPKVKVDFMKDDVARVWMEPSGIFQKDASFVVNNEQATTKPQVSDAGEYIKLQTPELTIRVYKQPFKIAYYDATNTNLITEESAKGLGYNGDTGVSENIKMDQDEHFYGLGMDKDQDAAVLDQRGRKVVMKNDMVSVNNEGNVSDISGTYLASTKGYGIYFDNTYVDTTFDMGNTDPDNYSFSAPNGEMVYYFMKGDNLNDTMKDYASLSGKAPIPPKWALGYIQSKFGYRSWDEVNDVVDTFRSKGIPVDGMVLDAYWAANNHYFDMTWSDAFKDPKAAMDALAAKGIKMTNIVDPYIQVTSNLFEEGKKKGYFVKDSSGSTVVYDAWYGKSGLIDYTNLEAAKWYTDHVKELHDSGVKGWWIDLNEPEKPTDPVTDQFQVGNAGEVKNAYALEEAKAFYNGQRSYTNERVWSLARSGFSGIQQYGTTVWSGDNSSTWQAFTHNLQKGISAGMSGIPYFTNDTGGFIQGPPSAELYTRWMQASAFMPIFRAHGDDSANQGKGEREPWAFGTEAEGIVTKAIKQRYELLPYIYAAARQTSIDNTPIMRALAADYTSDSKVTNITDQWMFGSSMMVAPVHEQGSVSREVYLPEGTWYDWNDDTKEYTGGNSIDYAAALDKTPVFVKEGSIIPIGQNVNYVGEKPDDYINLKVYPKASGEETKFSLYEDDGNTYSYEKNQSATTDITTEEINGTINLNIAAINGEYQGKVTDRVWAAQVKVDSLDKIVTNIKRNNVKLRQVNSMDDLNAGSDVWYYDSNTETVYLRTSKVSTSAAQNISIDTSNESNTSNGLAELQELYDAHKNDTQGNYTVASWTNFVTALNNAKSVIDSADAMQTQIDNAKANLQSAIGSLKIQSSNSDHGSSGSSSSSNSSSSNSSSSAETTNSNKTEDSNVGGNTAKNGWNKVNDSWQFVKPDGSLVTGWYNDNGTWYNLSNEGMMNTGWIKDTDGKWYYLRNSGEMATDWVKDTDGNWYYLKNSGEMATGWVKDTDGKWYYLKSSGAMASNEYIDGYYLGTSGAWIQ